MALMVWIQIYHFGPICRDPLDIFVGVLHLYKVAKSMKSIEKIRKLLMYIRNEMLPKIATYKNKPSNPMPKDKQTNDVPRAYV